MSDRPAAEVEGLAGVRLGELERTLLMAAPTPGSVGGGLLIDAPEESPSTQQGYLRAAKKLERHGLVRRDHVPEATRAHDPRRARPFYLHDRFWLRADPSRRHLVRRVVIWVTPFTLVVVDPSPPSTSPTAEKPKLTHAERAERLKLLAERLRDPDGLDRAALAQVEQLTTDEQ